MVDVSTAVPCSHCSLAPSQIFCLCTSSPTPLCQSCISLHSQSPGNHDISPIDHLPYALAISIDLYKKKKLGIAQALAFIDTIHLQELSHYNASKELLRNYVESATFFIESLHCTLINTLETLKNNVQNAIYTVNSPEIVDFLLGNGQRMQNSMINLYDIPVIEAIEAEKNRISATLSEFQSKDFSNYLFSHIKSEFLGTKKPQKISQSTKIDSFLPVFHRNILRKYGAEGNAMELVEFPMCPRVDEETAYALMSSGDVFCCGGSNATRNAYYLGSKSAKMTILPNLSYGRGRPGVICFNNFPYIFGGRNRKIGLVFCERLLTTDNWELLPSSMLHARSGFTPVLSSSCIYLPGGSETTHIERFDPISLSFHLLSPCLSTPGKTISFLSSQDLYILSADHVTILNLPTSQAKIAAFRCDIRTWSPIAPLICNEKALFWGFAKVGLIDSLRMTFGGTKHGIIYSFDVLKLRLFEIERFEYSKAA